MIEASQMVEGDANLEDALIQPSYPAPLGAPQQLQRFVLLEIFAAIELRDPVQQKLWCRLVALRRAHLHNDPALSSCHEGCGDCRSRRDSIAESALHFQLGLEA